MRLAQATGGYVLRSTSDNQLAFADLFKHDLKAPTPPTRPIWPWLLTLAALLLPFDIAVRRLVISRHDLQRAWQKAGAWLSARRQQLTPQPAPRSEQLSSLFRAKGRVQEPKETVDGAKPPGEAPVRLPTTAAPPAAPEPEPRVPAAPSALPGPAPTSTSAALLAAKKRAREKKD